MQLVIGIVLGVAAGLAVGALVASRVAIGRRRAAAEQEIARMTADAERSADAIRREAQVEAK